MRRTVCLLALAAFLIPVPLPAQTPAPDARFSRTTAMVPMRDGVKLYTAVYAPRDRTEPLPIILLRTPYGIDNRTERILRGYFRDLVEDGYLFVFQDIRGRFKSEGRFVMMRPPRDASDPKAVDEASDTQDTLDWVLGNVKGHNGRVGMLGVSYDGWLTAVAMLDPHPALKAASPQASPADMFLGDDFHHNGAFRLSYGFEYVAMMETDKESRPFPFDRRDTYEWYLKLGALANVNARHFDGKRPTWNDFVAHPNYDAFWKKQSLEPRLNRVTVPTLHVAAWFDQEDFRGPLKIYELLEKHDAKGQNFLVVGPWNHGGWRDGPGDRLGKITFDSATGKHFRQQVQAPFFARHLKDQGKGEQPEAVMFQTGANQWVNYDTWPPKGTASRKLFFHPDGKLSFAPPGETERPYDAYRSDPANPVPYRPRPVTPTYPGREWKEWMVEDQRFTHRRPDVLSYETEPLTEDVVVAGPMIAWLFAATSATDCDWVVRLIDVYPEDYPDDPEMGGYQLLISGEPFRARFRKSFEKPEAVVPSRVEEYVIDLHWGHHRFRKGHRIMVQVSSTWFPLIDRNPQKYIPNIFEAKDADFQTARQRVYRSRELASHVQLETLSDPGVQEALREALWAAVRDGDARAVAAALDRGADINARNKIGVTALWIAAGGGKREVIELLVRRGADVNARDGIWYQTPLSSSAGGGNVEVVKLLIRAGAKDVEEMILPAAARGRVAVLQALLDGGKVKQEVLDAALIAVPAGNREVREALQKAGANSPRQPSEEERKSWKALAGTYEYDNGGRLTVELTDHGLAARRQGFPHLLKPTGPDTFTPVGLPASYRFVRDGDQAVRVVVKYHTSEITYYRLETKPVATAVDPPREAASGTVAAPLNWPSFRGPDASGVADGQQPPLKWDVKDGTNVRWKTPIPGLGHSCPIVWGDRIFVTTAISGDPDPKVRVGNYGDVGSVNDTTEHRWQVLCLDRDSGKILWTRTAFTGVPKIKRHLKGSQANCTPATDGKRVVACFGSEGLYCYDFTGKLLWQRDLGTLDSSFAIDVKYEWGFGSSPILHDGLVILQCDLGKDSFLAAYRLEDGSRAWSTPRDEIPSWSTPAIWRTARRVEVVTNAAQYARGYDPATGQELWRLAKKSEITVPTPVVGTELAYITSGNRPIQPILAVRPGASGDISLKPDEERNDHVAWSRMRGGPYMPTPILYGKYLYTCGNGGMVSCYEADTGKEVYKERLGGVSYTASPVAADGRLYFTTEQGQIRVVQAGPAFKLLAVNDLGDICMATPAISAGTLFVRSQHFLFALGQRSSGK